MKDPEMTTEDLRVELRNAAMLMSFEEGDRVLAPLKIERTLCLSYFR